MKIFSSNNLSESIRDLELGIVSAGDSKVFNYVLQNDSDAILTEMKYFFIDSRDTSKPPVIYDNIKTFHPEIKITKKPERMEPNSKEQLIVEWKASVTLKRGLKLGFDIEAASIYS